MLQPQVFAGQFLRRRLERRRRAAVQDFDVLGPDFDRAGAQLRIHGSLGPRGHAPADQHDELGPQRPGRLDQRRARLRGENHLGLAVAIAQIDEQHAAMVAIGIDPAAEGHLFSDVLQTKFAASMSPQQDSIPGDFRLALTSEPQFYRRKPVAGRPAAAGLWPVASLSPRRLSASDRL